MKQTKNKLLTIQKDGLTLTMSIVEKESNSGIMHNQRLFVLNEGHFFGYISKFKLTDDPNKINLINVKSSVPIKLIKSIQTKQDQLTIKFLQQIQLKVTQKSWVLKMANQKMVQDWYKKLQQEKTKKTHRSNYKISKDSKQKQKQESPNKDQAKQRNTKIPMMTNENKQTRSEAKIQQTTQLKKDKNTQFNNNNKQSSPQIKKQQLPERRMEVQDDNEVQQFVNPLYTEYDSVQERQLQLRKQALKKKQEPTIKKGQKIQTKSKQPLAFQKQSQEEEAVYKNKKSQIQESKKRDFNKPSQSRFKQSVEPNPNFLRQPNFIISQYKNNPKQRLFQKQINEPIKIKQNQQPSIVKKVPVSKKDQANYMQMIQKIVASSNKKSNKNLQYRYGQTELLKRKFKLTEQVRQLQKDPQQVQRLQIVHQFALNLQKQNMQNQTRNKMFQKSQNSPNAQLQDLPWGYRYLADDSPDTSSAFSKYCQQIIKKLVDELPFSHTKATTFKPKVKKNNILIYNFQQCQIKIALIVLKQISIKSQSNQQGKQERICDYITHKQLQIQYKNYCALNSYIKNHAKLKTPLISLVQYNGFLALFKVNSKFSNHNIIDQRFIESQQKQITNLSRIQTELYSSISKSVVIKIDQKYYKELDQPFRRMKMFDYHIIQEIDDFLVHDFLSKSIPYLILRNQLIKQHSQKNVLYKNVRADKIKSINKAEGTKIQNLSKKVLTNISNFIISLDNLSFYFLHPIELSQAMHQNGINMRYLGLIYDNTTLQFSKASIMTQIAARTCKLLLRKTLQDIYLQKSDSGYFSQQDLHFKMIDFLNCILGNSYQTAAIWKVLSFHSQFFFKIPINIQQIEKGLFLISISYHCNFDVQWSKLNPSEVFKVNNFLNQQNFIGLKMKTKLYEPIHNQKYQKTLQLLKEESQQNFNQIVSMFRIKQNPIPQFFKQNNKQAKLKKYLVQFIQPSSIVNSNSFPHLRLFQSTDILSRDQFDIALMEIKWYFRKNKRQKYIKCCEALITKINKYFGDFHPILNEVYDLFSNYHMNKSEYDDSTTFAKSSLVNTLKICGTNHQKTSECYFNLALCYIKSNKKDEAVSLLKKSKLIFENNEKTQVTAYAVINLKLALLYLNQNNIEDCMKCTQLALSIFSETRQKNQLQTYQDQVTQAYQLLSRCFQLKKSKDNLKKLGLRCQSFLPKLINPSNLQKTLKIALYPILSSMPTAYASLYLDLISMIPIQMSAKSYGRSFGLLKIRIKQESLMQNLTNYCENIESIDKFISQNETLKNWKWSQQLHPRQTVNDFISLTEQLTYFLGEGFLTGSLREAL